MEQFYPLIDLNKYIEILNGNHEAFSEFDTESLKRNISAFRKINLQTATNEELIEMATKTVPRNLVSEIDLLENTEFYRVRHNRQYNGRDESVFYESFEDVWYPKPEYLTDFGRLNNVKQSILYTSFDAMTPVHETSSKNGDHFAIIKYKIKSGEVLKLAEIAVENHKEISNKWLNWYRWTKNGLENWRIINEFLTTEFTKKVPSEKRYIYRSTIALSQRFDFPDCDGFIYPSIARGKGYNIAIKAESADRALEFAGLGYCMNIKYDGTALKSGDFSFLQKWASSASDERINYEPISPCGINFKGLGKINKEITNFSY